VLFSKGKLVIHKLFSCQLFQIYDLALQIFLNVSLQKNSTCLKRELVDEVLLGEPTIYFKLDINAVKNMCKMK